MSQRLRLRSARGPESVLPLALRRMILGALVVGASAAGWMFWPTWIDPDELLEQARAAFQEERYEDALKHAERVLGVHPQHWEALVVAGGAAAAHGDAERAIQFHERIPEDQGLPTADAHCIAAGLLLFDLHRAADAERWYRRILSQYPRHAEANSGLANLLGLTARRWEAISPTLELLRQGRCTANQLILIGSETGGHYEAALFEKCLEAFPNDPVALLGAAWHAHYDGRHPEAELLARRAVEAAPDLIAAHALLGRVLLELEAQTDPVSRYLPGIDSGRALGSGSADPDTDSDSGISARLQAWHAALPPGADGHPEIWLVRGEWARLRGEADAAIRCYWETLRLNPNYRTALYQVAQLLVGRGATDRALPYLQRSEALQRLKEAESVLFEGVQSSLDPIRAVAVRMQALGRLWEAWGWCQIASQLDPRAHWPRSMMQRLRPRLDQVVSLTIESSNPAFQEDLSDFPVPEWTHPKALPVRPPGLAAAAGNAISVPTFADMGPEAGVDFTYFNDADPAVAGQRMYEFSGGGVAAFDYDGDGWPDLYFTQGCRWETRGEGSDHYDALYRNLGDGRFEDVARQAGLMENGFGQGVAAGDFDGDGFPDLYVGNVGENRLYRNNGDGTFSDVTPALGGDPGLWTTSCLIADLNGNGWPDIYAVNYLDSADVFERICQHKDGAARMCAPFDFPAAQDQFYRNRGDGTFEEFTDPAGFAVPNGKGLGIAAGDFEGNGQLSLFVANDLVPNFFFVNRTPQRGDSPVFEERAFFAGLALNANGQAEGCMGIALEDMNEDGLLDLLVTNFLMESNTFYVQLGGGLFHDATAQAGLAAPSLPLLGFGAQCLDGALDGIPDLIITNGHVDDHRAYGQPFHMRPQYFRGLGSGRFVELGPQDVGPFFAGEYLGRGMARLDWNRDGREDVAISHIGAKAALLTNTTADVGRYLAVHLRGVTSERDAIGASVTVRAGGRTRTRQLTAGDGYQASNQRRLVFGLADSPRVDSLEVRWPSGIRQTFLDLAVDSELMLIEGNPRPFALGIPQQGGEPPDRL